MPEAFNVSSCGLASIVRFAQGMDHDTLEKFRRRLLNHRLSLVQRGRRASAEEEELLAEHEPDWVDVAASQTTATVLERLGETGRRELDRIDLALKRMEIGLYGECVVCRAPIDAQRLRAVPDTERCANCTFTP